MFHATGVESDDVLIRTRACNSSPSWRNMHVLYRYFLRTYYVYLDSLRNKTARCISTNFKAVCCWAQGFWSLTLISDSSKWMYVWCEDQTISFSLLFSIQSERAKQDSRRVFIARLAAYLPTTYLPTVDFFLFDLVGCTHTEVRNLSPINTKIWIKNFVSFWNLGRM